MSRSAALALALALVLAVGGCGSASSGSHPTSAAPGVTKEPRQEDAKERACRTLRSKVDASYRVRWKSTDTGRAWWIELTIGNRTGEVLWGEMGGTAEVTNMLEDPLGWKDGPHPGPGRDATARWGGSSADTLEVQPGTYQDFVAPDIDVDVHTTADGMLRVTRFDVGLGPTGTRYACRVPVRQM